MFTNLSISDARGVMIAVKIHANIKIIDTVKDDEDRIILIKVVIGKETITVGCIYDDNKNNTMTLTKLEELLDGRQGLVIGGDYNVIVNPQFDQHGYDTPHLRTKAVKHHNEWEASGKLIDIYRKKHKKGNAITCVPDRKHNRENPKLGRRLDTFLVSEDLNIKEV